MSFQIHFSMLVPRKSNETTDSIVSQGRIASFPYLVAGTHETAHLSPPSQSSLQGSEPVLIATCRFSLGLSLTKRLKSIEHKSQRILAAVNGGQDDFSYRSPSGQIWRVEGRNYLGHDVGSFYGFPNPGLIITMKLRREDEKDSIHCC